MADARSVVTSWPQVERLWEGTTAKLSQREWMWYF